MAYNRDWLKTQIVSYLKDGSVSAELDTWIDLAAKRVSHAMQCYEMEDELTRFQGVGDAVIPLPSTVRRVLGVQWLNYAGVWINLRSVPRHNAGQYKGDGNPAVYYIEGREVVPAPFSDQDYRVQVIQDVVIPTDTTEPEALVAHPFVFLNACLAEAYDWKQDLEMQARYEGKWIQEAQAVTAEYLGERGGETPSMRAM